MIRRNTTTILLLFIISPLFSQSISTLTLENSLKLARERSDDMRIVQYDSLIFYHQMKEFSKTILPQVILSSTPYLSQDIVAVTRPDGTEQFVNRRLANYGAKLNLSQLIPLTGGTLSVNSSFYGVENFGENKYHSFYMNWINVSYRQNFGRYNDYKWNKKILESERILKDLEYIQNIEKLNYKVANAFLESYMHQTDKSLQKILLEITQTNYKNCLSLYEVERINKEELINAEINYQQELVNYDNVINNKITDNTLRILLKMPDAIPLDLFFNDSLYLNTSLNFDKNVIIDRVLNYNFNLNLNFIDLEHRKKIAKNNFESGITWGINLYGGLNKSKDQFPLLFGRPNNQYKIEFSISIPVLDWGIARERQKRLDLERKLSQIIGNKNSNEYKINTIREIEEISYLHHSLKNSKKLLKLHVSRLELINEKLKLEKTTQIDFLKSKSEFMMSYVDYNTKLKKYIHLIFKYRYLALWDFLNDTPLYQ